MVEVNNLTTNRVDEKFLIELAKKVLKDKNKKMTELSIALVGPARIRELNKKYRQKNKVTDVLSFQYNGLGEVVICLPVLKKNAKKFKSTFKEELARVLTHGISNL
jgi:probable rRNA maturation factor